MRWVGLLLLQKFVPEAKRKKEKSAMEITDLRQWDPSTIPIRDSSRIILDTSSIITLISSISHRDTPSLQSILSSLRHEKEMHPLLMGQVRDEICACVDTRPLHRMHSLLDRFREWIVCEPAMCQARRIVVDLALASLVERDRCVYYMLCECVYVCVWCVNLFHKGTRNTLKHKQV